MSLVMYFCFTDFVEARILYFDLQCFARDGNQWRVFALKYSTRIARIELRDFPHKILAPPNNLEHERELGNELWTRHKRNLLIKNQEENNNELTPAESTLYYKFAYGISLPGGDIL